MGLTAHYGHVYLDRRRIGQMALRGSTPAKMAKAINERKPFVFGSVSSFVLKKGIVPTTGILPSFLSDQLMAAIDTNEQTYVVYSFQTPIGWTTEDGWFVPEITYSASTTNHQNVLRNIVL